MCRKKFLIENLEGTKVVSRKKGFTTTTCVSGVAIGQQTKRFEALPESAKVSWLFQGFPLDISAVAGLTTYHLSSSAHVLLFNVQLLLCSQMQQTINYAARQQGQIWSRPAMHRVHELAQLP